jgi:hypothetical protein
MRAGRRRRGPRRGLVLPRLGPADVRPAPRLAGSAHRRGWNKDQHRNGGRRTRGSRVFTYHLQGGERTRGRGALKIGLIGPIGRIRRPCVGRDPEGFSPPGLRGAHHCRGPPARGRKPGSPGARGPHRWERCEAWATPGSRVFTCHLAVWGALDPPAALPPSPRLRRAGGQSSVSSIPAETRAAWACLGPAGGGALARDAKDSKDHRDSPCDAGKGKPPARRACAQRIVAVVFRPRAAQEAHSPEGLARGYRTWPADGTGARLGQRPAPARGLGHRRRGQILTGAAGAGLASVRFSLVGRGWGAGAGSSGRAPAFAEASAGRRAVLGPVEPPPRRGKIERRKERHRFTGTAERIGAWWVQGTHREEAVEEDSPRPAENARHRRCSGVGRLRATGSQPGGLVAAATS